MTALYGISAIEFKSRISNLNQVERAGEGR